MPKSQRHKEFAGRLRVAVARRWGTGRGAASRFAEALGVTASHASAYLRGDRLPEGSIALRLPELLGVAADYFSTDAPEGGKQAPGRPATPRSGRGLDRAAYAAGARAALDELAKHITALRSRWDAGSDQELLEDVEATSVVDALQQQEEAGGGASPRRKKRA